MFGLLFGLFSEGDACVSNPCGLGGFCVPDEGNYTCVCDPFYTGVNCEGEFTSNNYTCVCDPYYMGVNCEGEFTSNKI